VAYSRFYDENFPDDKSAPLITYAEGVDPVHADLTFSDISHTTLLSEGKGDGSSGGGGGGCDAGLGSTMALVIGFAATGSAIKK